MNVLMFTLILYFIVVPTPNVSINAMIYDAMIVGQPLVLECVVTAVRGINSQVNMLWSNINSNEELRKTNVTASVIMFGSVVYRDYLNISQLTTENNDVTYECKIMINDVVASNRFTLYVTGKHLSYINHKTLIF